MTVDHEVKVGGRDLPTAIYRKERWMHQMLGVETKGEDESHQR